MKTFRLRIVTPDRVVFDEAVRAVRFPGIDGSYGVLPNHAPLMTATAPGIVYITRTEGGAVEEMLISDGFAEVRSNVLTIAASAGELAYEIDVDKYRELERQAREKLAHRAELVDEEILVAEIQLRRALLGQTLGGRSRAPAPHSDAH
ncbi:MAG: ATP synthase F1 subunit epsilon [Planctomycetes bacterium]|nr:ATP synthase F1 subunit epsilon [Planctomycetota bacterium]